MRWRTEAEVLSGKGSTLCGAKSCTMGASLRSFELPFNYREDGVAKSELVSAILCPFCAECLHNAKKLADKHSSTVSSGVKRKVQGADIDLFPEGSTLPRSADTIHEEIEKIKKPKKKKKKKKSFHVDDGDSAKV